MVWFLIGFVIALALAPRPEFQDATAATEDDFNIPTASESDPIPVPFGTNKLTAPNVINWGGLVVTPIYEKVDGGLFSSDKKVKVGFKYNLFLDFALCWGPVELIKIEVGDFTLWEGSKTQNEVFTISQSGLFGEEGGGESGIEGDAAFYYGDGTPVNDPYMLEQVGPRPGNTGIARLIWRGGYIGNNTNLRPWAFVVRRFPDGLGTGYGNIDGDANPALIIYEVLTNPFFGLAIGNADPQNFAEVAETLYNEGRGVSFVWKGGNNGRELINDVMRHINGIFRTDLSTNKLQLKLLRDDAVTIPEITEDQIITLKKLGRGDVGDIPTEVRIEYVDRAAGFIKRVAMAENVAAVAMTGEPITSNLKYHAISNGDHASAVATRELTTMLQTPAEIQIETNRAPELQRGDVCEIVYPKEGIERMRCRLVEIDWGDLKSGVVSMKLIEDSFYYGAAVFAGPDEPQWEPGQYNPDPVTIYHYTNATRWHRETGGVLTFAVQPVAAFTANVHAGLGATPTTYNLLTADHEFATYGTLPAAVTAGADSFDVDTLDQLRALNLDEMRAGGNLALVTDGTNEEFLTFGGVTATATGYTLTNVKRGILDTPPRAWAAGASFWLVEDIPANSLALNSGQLGGFKLVCKGFSSSENVEDVTPVFITGNARHKRPNVPPLFINGEFYPDFAEGDVVATWKHRPHDPTIALPEDASGDGEGFTYTVKIYSAAGALLRTVADLTDTTYTYDAATETADGGPFASLRVDVIAHYDGVQSLPASATFERLSGNDNYFIATSSTTEGTATTFSETIPAQAQAGDLLIAAVMGRDTLTATPAGWSLLTSQAFSHNSYAQELFIYTKTATSGDAGSVISFTQASSQRHAINICVYRGVSVAATASQPSFDSNYGGKIPVAALAGFTSSDLCINICTNIYADTSTPQTIAPTGFTAMTPESSARLGVGRASITGTSSGYWDKAATRYPDETSAGSITLRLTAV